MTEQNTELVLVAEQSGLEKNKVETLLSKFEKPFYDAKELIKESRKIVVDDENDIESMTKARELRLTLQKIRTKGVEELRKELKEQSLREGKAIDGMANIIKALIIPEEKYLELQEKYAENKERERLQKRLENRTTLLTPYVSDVSIYKLDEMSDEVFEQILQTNKDLYEARVAEEKKAEEERRANELKQSVLTERKEKLLPYSIFTDISKLTLDTTNSEFNEMMKQAIDAKKLHDKNQEEIRIENEKLRKAQEEEKLKREKEAEARRKAEEKIKAENEAKLEAERKKTQEAEKKLREAKELEEKKLLEEKQEAERLKRLEEEAQQKALLAPDKEKLMQLVIAYENVELPAVKSKKANDILIEVEKRETALRDWIYEEAKKL